MHRLRVRIDRIIDFNVVVSLVGVDTETAKPVAVHVDHRPFAVFQRALQEAGIGQPIEYAADRLMLHLDMVPADGAESVSISKSNRSAADAMPNDVCTGREVDR